MATHSSVLAWRIPGTEEPGGLLSPGSHRVAHDWNDLAAEVAVHSQCCISMLLCNHHHYQMLVHFHHPKKESLYQLAVTPHSPSLAPETTNLLFVSIDVSILNISYIFLVPFLFFCFYLLSLNVMLSRFIHVIAWISNFIPFYSLNNIPLYGYVIFYYPLISRWTFGLFPFFGYYKQCHYEYSCRSICINICLQFSWVYT